MRWWWQALAGSISTKRVQLGRAVTRGLGAGAKPSVGRLAAEESLDDVLAQIGDSRIHSIAPSAC